MTAPIHPGLFGDQHEHLKSFLFPGDGNEAVAILLCAAARATAAIAGRARDSRIPYEDCRNDPPMRVTWPPDYNRSDAGISPPSKTVGRQVHSHPGGYAASR